MIDVNQVAHHPVVEEIVDVLCAKVQNPDRTYFRALSAYFLAKVAASMRATIRTKNRGDLPVNVYAIALATSGFGKGHSLNILEKEFLGLFEERFKKDTFPAIADLNLWKIANEKSALLSTAEKPVTAEEEKNKLDKVFANKGAYPFTFSKATPAAVQQIRQKLLMATIGAINLQIDEIGDNLLGATDVLTAFYDLYDVGLTKESITKNTNESARDEEMPGNTPTNALLFGTPASLFDGGPKEDAFYGFLASGYARRCLFAWGTTQPVPVNLSLSERARQVYEQQISSQNAAITANLAHHFWNLADQTKFNWLMMVEDDVGIELTEYQLACKDKAEAMGPFQEIRSAEMMHRYFKALKLAGAYAFVDESPEITMEHLAQAIKLVEESGAAFDRMMTREKPSVKLAKYLGSCGTEVTHSDLEDMFAFYKGPTSKKNDLMTQARSWGYKNHHLIRRRFVDEGIEVFSGETLQQTDTTKMLVSYSDHFAYNYQPEFEAPFDQLDKLVTAPGMNWCNHHFQNEHRARENVIPGFNMIVLDVDGGITLDTVHELLGEYRFMTYTTKRHSATDHRFRVVMPINYLLKLDTDDYTAFMKGVLEWAPFASDPSAAEPEKKWLTHPGAQVHFNDGVLFDALPFIPRTSKNEEYDRKMEPLRSLDNLERYFAQRMGPEGSGRNNLMIKYALALVDAGMGIVEVERRVINFNAQIPNGLAEDELRNTVLVTAAKRISIRNAA